MVQVRITDNVKTELESILDELGLTTSQAIVMYIKQIILKKRIPLDLSISNDYDDKELTADEFKKINSALISKLDTGESIPETNSKNERPFKY